MVLISSLKTLRLATPVARLATAKLLAQRSLLTAFPSTKASVATQYRFASTTAAKSKETTTSGRQTKTKTKKASSATKKSAAKTTKKTTKKASKPKAAATKKKAVKKPSTPPLKLTKFPPVSTQKVFANAIIDQLRAEKHTNNTSLKRSIKEKYAALSESEKAKYLEEAKKLRSTEKKKLKVKERKEKLPPKYSPYILYVKENMKPLIEANPELRVTQGVKQLAEKWRNMSPAEKQDYEQRAAGFLKAYNEKKAQIESAKVKKPVNAFALFYKELYPQLAEQNPDKHPHEVVKVAAEQWRNMEDSEKAKYVNQSVSTQEAYQRTIA